MTCRIISWKT